MQGYFEYAGVMYDSLLFLSSCCENRHLDTLQSDTQKCIKIIKSELGDIEIVPSYLHPFFCPYQKSKSFVQAVLFDQLKYGQCTLEKACQIANNIQYMTRKFVEFYFPELSSDESLKVMKLTFPDSIEIITKSATSSAFGTHFIFALTYFDKMIKSAIDIINQIYSVMEKKHRRFIAENQNILSQARQAKAADKLKVISNAKESNFMFQFSLSLLDEEIIAFNQNDPACFLLGKRYDDVLENKYRYYNVSALSFARALGNESKCIIFEALLTQPPMSIGEMEIQLHLSRNAVAKNIKEMRESGLVRVERTEGLSYYYSINYDYIDVATKSLQKLRNMKNQQVML